MIVGTMPEQVELPLALPQNACNGHFPGHPLVPGVLQLQLVAEALGIGQASDVAVGAIPRVRFRKPILPDDETHLEARRTDSTWRFRIITKKRIVTEGALEMATLPHLAPVAGEAPTQDEIELSERLLPHRAPMLLVHRVLESGDGWGSCDASVSSEAQFARGGSIPALAALEVAAQSLGLIEGAAASEEGSPRIGLLVGIANARLAAATFPAGSKVTAQVERTASVPPMARAEARVTSGDQEIATCTLTTWTPEPDEGEDAETAD
jgi:3-hydroxymyristoyl/3-hydroxydecanoyl-(acyl carrier protein) dehydratase